MTGLQVTESARQGRWPVVPAMVSMLLLCATASATGAASFEAPANRKASEILPAELIQGPHYRVQDTVVSYGYMHHWTPSSRAASSAGRFSVSALRRIRFQEITT